MLHVPNPSHCSNHRLLSGTVMQKKKKKKIAARTGIFLHPLLQAAATPLLHQRDLMLRYSLSHWLLLATHPFSTDSPLNHHRVSVGSTDTDTPPSETVRLAKLLLSQSSPLSPDRLQRCCMPLAKGCSAISKHWMGSLQLSTSCLRNVRIADAALFFPLFKPCRMHRSLYSSTPSWVQVDALVIMSWSKYRRICHQVR